jgi:hypothetical protein
VEGAKNESLARVKISLDQLISKNGHLYKQDAKESERKEKE